MADKIKALPSDLAERKRLLKSVQECVDSHVRMTSEKDLIAGIIDVEKCDHGYDTSYFRSLVALTYDEQYDGKKKASKIEEQSELLSEVAILLGNSIEE